MPTEISQPKTLRACAILSFVVVLTALSAGAQQVQVDSKNALSDNKSQSAPPPAPTPVSYVVPQMIGDQGFGLALSPFKIAENESPRPTDRVFLTYNYFSNIGGAQNNNFNIDVHREVIGFEKTFFDGAASIGLRLPFSTVDQTFFGNSKTDTNFGDLSLITKFALYNDPATGNVFSAGLSITPPTETGNPDFRDVKFQPFIGAIYIPFRSGTPSQGSNFYIQALSSIVLPTDSRDDKLLFNSFGTGFWLYNNPSTFVRSVVPTFEVHITTPIDSNTSTWVNLTPGVHIQLPGQTWLTIGGTVPVAGPKPFDFEIVTQFNVHF